MSGETGKYLYTYWFLIIKYYVLINTSHIQVSIQGGIKEGGERYYSKVRKIIEFGEGFTRRFTT